MKKNLNLYIVASETMYETIPILDDGSGPSEPWAICDLVIARNRRAAEYLAWKSSEDNYFNYDMRDKPKFQTQTLAKNVGAKPRIVSENRRFYKFWRAVEWEKISNDVF